MHNDRKRTLRITVERVKITTVRTGRKKTYCDICRCSLEKEELDLAEPHEIDDTLAAISEPDIKIGAKK